MPVFIFDVEDFFIVWGYEFDSEGCIDRPLDKMNCPNKSEEKKGSAAHSAAGGFNYVN